MNSFICVPTTITLNRAVFIWKRGESGQQSNPCDYLEAKLTLINCSHLYKGFWMRAAYANAHELYQID